MAKEIRFLADESCDFRIVRALRAAGYDVVAVSEIAQSAPDSEVLQIAVENDQILITEDSDFGEWVFSHGKKMKGVLFIRFPANVRSKLNENVLLLVDKYGKDLIYSFTVMEPGRVRIRKNL